MHDMEKRTFRKGGIIGPRNRFADNMQSRSDPRKYGLLLLRSSILSYTFPHTIDVEIERSNWQRLDEQCYRFSCPR